MIEDDIGLGHHGWLGRGILHHDMTHPVRPPTNPPMQTELTPDRCTIAGAMHKGQLSCYAMSTVPNLLALISAIRQRKGEKITVL
jgi:hypothetical protein